MYTYEVEEYISNGKSVKITGRNKKEAKRKAEQFIAQHVGYIIVMHYQGEGKN